MKYLALYRKYRPSSFNEMFGQDKIVQVLRNAVSLGKISHAYLFCGPRGTGKTTTAKLIAKMVNCLEPIDGEPCGKCENCLSIINNKCDDIIEIDAASNNGVDEIREIRDKVSLVPSKLKYKVYIIDEVHMLTTGAFNALLKTLEEPPSHVIFILATTEYYKIPLTITSRCQKFSFTKITADNIVERLKQIIELENIDIDDLAIKEIARLSDGGMRDAINMLDQLSSYKSDKILPDDVYEINGTVSYIDIYNILKYVVINDIPNILKIVSDLENSGKNISKLIEEIIIFLKDTLIMMNINEVDCSLEKQQKLREISASMTLDIIYDFINQLNILLKDVKNSSYPGILLQVLLIKMSNLFTSNCKNNTKNTVKQTKNEEKNDSIAEVPVDNSKSSTKNKEKEKTLVDKVKNDDDDNENLNKLKEIRVNNSLAVANKNELLVLKQNWKKIDEFILDKKYSKIAGLLKDTEPIVCGEGYVLLKTKLLSISNSVNELLEDASKIIEMIYKKVKTYALTEEEWDIIKKQYIANVTNNKKYKLMEDNIEVISPKKSVGIDSSVKELIDTFGDELIEYK